MEFRVGGLRVCMGQKASSDRGLLTPVSDSGLRVGREEHDESLH